MLEKSLYSVLLIIQGVSLSYLGAPFVRTERAWSNFRDIYLLTWLITLTILLFVWSLPQWVTVLIVSLRLVDILSYHLWIVLIDSQRSNWALASVRRSLLSAFLNFYEITTAYAIIYLSVGNIIQNSPSKTPLHGPVQAFYYSLVTIATLGYGEFVPADDPSRVIVIAELLTEILFVIAIIPALAANITTRLAGREYRDLDTRE